MKYVDIIEARMTSSRLPGKVLMESCGLPMLQLMIERIRRSRILDDVVVATTVNETDDLIVELCSSIGCHYYRGSEDDVMGRVLYAAESVNADVIVETTGDCPLIDWRHIDNIIRIYKSANYDYVANNMIQSYPDGFDIRIFSTKILRDAYERTDDPMDHEHVSIFFPNRPDEYKCYNVLACDEECRPEIEVTLDEMGDYRLINAIFEGLYKSNPDFSCKDVIGYIDEHPENLKYVADIKRTEIHYEGREKITL